MQISQIPVMQINHQLCTRKRLYLLFMRCQGDSIFSLLLSGWIMSHTKTTTKEIPVIIKLQLFFVYEYYNMCHVFCGNYNFCVLFLQKKKRNGNNGDVNFARVSQQWFIYNVVLWHIWPSSKIATPMIWALHQAGISVLFKLIVN